MIMMTPIYERQRAHFYIYNKQKNCETFLYTHKQKSRHFAKRKTICVIFLLTKSRTLCVTRFVINVLKLTLYVYQKHDTLRYVMFLYTKIRTLQKIERQF